MNKREAVELIFLNVNGGKFTDEAPVQIPDIEAYLPLALASAIKAAMFEEKNSARADKGQGILFEDALPESFYTTYAFTPTKDNERGAWVASLPKAFGMEYGWGVRHPRPKANPGNDFFRLPHAGIASAMSAAFHGARMYWTEEADGETKLFLTGVTPPVCEMLVSIIKDPKYQEDDEEIFAPKDALDNAVRAAVNFFRAQAGTPASERLDDKAINEGE